MSWVDLEYEFDWEKPNSPMDLNKIDRDSNKKKYLKAAKDRNFKQFYLTKTIFNSTKVTQARRQLRTYRIA